VSPAAVVLAAGEGVRLRPLTRLRPKPLCPVGGRPLLAWALDDVEAVVGRGRGSVAVNVHEHAAALRAWIGSRAHVPHEEPEALGTAGALAWLRPWLDGRDVLVHNGDAYLPDGLEPLAAGWTGRRCRLLCVPVEGPGDFGAGGPAGLRYVGACLLPGALVNGLRAEPTGLWEVLWRDLLPAGELEFAVLPDDAVAIDCGTPQRYLAANLHASGGASVVGAGARVLGRLESSVVWDGAYVGPDETLVRTIRAGDEADPVTVAAG
jgi:MurNAc alpha-1-phosphate uridylyltransferase